MRDELLANNRVGERRGRRKPVCAGNVKPDCKRHGFRTQPPASPDNGEQSERGDEFTEELGTASPNVLRYLKYRLREHEMRGPHTEHCAYGLRRDISRNVAPAHPALARVRERDGRVEMRTGNRAESKNEGYQRGARRQRVCKQRDCDVAAAQALTHDAGADDRGQQQRGSEQLSDKTAGRVHEQQPARSSLLAFSRAQRRS